MFDFKNATIQENGSFISEPGFYSGKIVEAKLVKPDDSTKTPHLAVTFETSAGRITERFFISGPALGRLKLLFQGVWGKELEQTFNSVDEVANFFITSLTTTEKPVGIKVILEKTGEKQYSKLPFSDFISIDFANFKERVVKPEDNDYPLFVTTRKVETPKTGDTIITSSSANVPSWSPAITRDDSSDLPF